MFGHMSGFYGGWLAWFFWIVILALVVLVFVRLFSPSRYVRRGGSDADDPEVILKRRYARGEIGKEEYDKKLADLRR